MFRNEHRAQQSSRRTTMIKSRNVLTIDQATQDELIRRAIGIREFAYAKYSKYRVGASLLADDGAIFDGVNVENASFGLTTCAERSAIFSAVTAGRQRFEAIAIASEGGYPPCGACRQVLTEFAPDLHIMLVDPAAPDSIREFTMEQLLPGRFVFPETKLGHTSN